MRQNREIDGPAGKVRFHATETFAAVRGRSGSRGRLGVEQSNISLAFGD